MQTAQADRIDELLVEYGDSHQNPTNKLIHWYCVPLIVLSTVGLFWSIPSSFLSFWAPAAVQPFINFGTLLLLVAMVYYLSLSKVIFFAMIPMIAVVVAINYSIVNAGLSLVLVSAAIFGVAWFVQFIGHKIEGKKPSFFKDIQFLLVGPAWLLSFMLRRWGISYSAAS